MDDARKITLKHGLAQCSKAELLTLRCMPEDQICLDTYRYDEQRGVYWPLAIGLGVSQIPHEKTDEAVSRLIEMLSTCGLNGLHGVTGTFYTVDRYKDLMEVVDELIDEH